MPCVIIIKDTRCPPLKRHVNPCTGRDRPWGCHENEVPTFQNNRHMKVVRLSALRTGRHYPPSPGNIPGTHFCDRLSRPQGHSGAGRIIPIKNSIDIAWNRTRDLPACSAVPPITQRRGVIIQNNSVMFFCIHIGWQFPERRAQHCWQPTKRSLVLQT